MKRRGNIKNQWITIAILAVFNFFLSILPGLITGSFDDVLIPFVFLAPIIILVVLARTGFILTSKDNAPRYLIITLLSVFALTQFLIVIS